MRALCPDPALLDTLELVRFGFNWFMHYISREMVDIKINLKESKKKSRIVILGKEKYKLHRIAKSIPPFFGGTINLPHIYCKG